MKNGEFWYDTNGNVIHAHGGWILKVGEYYYWYGENRTEDIFVSCYRTKDFKTFEFRNHVLTARSVSKPSYVVNAEQKLFTPLEKLGEFTRGGLRRVINEEKLLVNIERPKVVYCEKTGKYVMWMHYENGLNYDVAGCAVASCDTPHGDFVYHGSFNPFGYMSRDCTVFFEDGDMYFISTARNNRDLHIYRMTEDYMSVDKLVNILYQNQSREAPAFFKKQGKTFLISSACSGFRPNQGTYSSSSGGLKGRWSLLSDFGDELTFRSQSAFVLSAEENGKTEYYYFGDRWGTTSSEYFTSTYVVLKIQFDQDGNPFIEYSDDAQLPQINA